MGIERGRSSYGTDDANVGAIAHGTEREFELRVEEERERLARDETFSDSERERLMEMAETSLRAELGLPRMPPEPALNSYPEIQQLLAEIRQIAESI